MHRTALIAAGLAASSVALVFAFTLWARNPERLAERAAVPTPVASAPGSPSEEVAAPMDEAVAFNPLYGESVAGNEVVAATTAGASPIAERLVASRWSVGGAEMAFTADGEWQVGGKARAKWEIVDGRIRIFDDKGEEHFAEFGDDAIIFNGERLEPLTD